jgi:hypothetical protein
MRFLAGEHLWFWDGYAKSEAMPSNPDQPTPRPASEQVPDPAKTRPLPPAAERALAEATARRAEHDRKRDAANQPKEVGGRDGPDPTRYGDWEINGLVSDF